MLHLAIPYVLLLLLRLLLLLNVHIRDMRKHLFQYVSLGISAQEVMRLDECSIQKQEPEIMHRFASQELVKTYFGALWKKIL
jgi:hypothetical protein